MEYPRFMIQRILIVKAMLFMLKRLRNMQKSNNIYVNEITITNNPYFRGNDDTISEFKNRTTTYINKIYDKLKNTKQKCILLVSVNPAYNPYHKSLIVGVDSRIPKC